MIPLPRPIAPWPLPSFMAAGSLWTRKRSFTAPTPLGRNFSSRLLQLSSPRRVTDWGGSRSSGITAIRQLRLVPECGLFPCLLDRTFSPSLSCSPIIPHCECQPVQCHHLADQVINGREYFNRFPIIFIEPKFMQHAAQSDHQRFNRRMLPEQR
jgi:hypothetical protein